MKILRILVILALFSGSAFADGTKLYVATGTVTNTGIRLVGSGIIYHKLTWYKSGTVTVCTVFVDSSADGSSWSAGGTIGSQDCSSNGATVVTSSNVNYIRVRVASWTGTGSVQVRWNGYNTRPGGLPAAGADGACLQSSGGDWVRGTCSGTSTFDSIVNPAGDKAFTMSGYTANFNFTGNYGANWAYSISSSSGANAATGYLFEVNAGGTNNKVISLTHGSDGLAIDATGKLAKVGSGSIDPASLPATPLPTPGTSLTMAAPRGYGFCSGGACAVTLPTPAAGYEFCVRNADNETNVITLVNLTGVQFEAPARTSYYVANRKLVSGGTKTDQICVLGVDATHYAVMSSVGTWTDTAP